MPSSIWFQFSLALRGQTVIDGLRRSLPTTLLHSVLFYFKMTQWALRSCGHLSLSPCPSLWEYWYFLSKTAKKHLSFSGFFCLFVCFWLVVFVFGLVWFFGIFPISFNNFLLLIPNLYERYTELRLTLCFPIDFLNTCCIQYPTYKAHRELYHKRVIPVFFLI